MKAIQTTQNSQTAEKSRQRKEAMSYWEINGKSYEMFTLTLQTELFDKLAKSSLFRVAIVKDASVSSGYVVADVVCLAETADRVELGKIIYGQEKILPRKNSKKQSEQVKAIITKVWLINNRREKLNDR